MLAAQQALLALRSGHPIDSALLSRVNLLPAQRGAAAAAIWHFRGTGVYAAGHWEAVAPTSFAGIDRVSHPLDFLGPSSVWNEIVLTLHLRRAPSREQLSAAFGSIKGSSDADLGLIGAFLMLCFLGYMPDGGCQVLTDSMAASGATCDLRAEFESAGFKLVRRYPTGGLSEKVALILPALIQHLGDKYRVKSPFMVARSLGFTGGTRDKLSSIPQFNFPGTSEEIKARLKAGHVAMTATEGNFDPADDVLYQLRSQTCTVESDVLIVSSIASKHIAIPAHLVLLDVRIGDGAFLPNYEAARPIAQQITAALAAHKIESLVSVMSTEQMNGSSVGNFLELLEALQILGGKDSTLFDGRGLQEQTNICIDFLVKMICAVNRDYSPQEVFHDAKEAFLSGELLNSFGTILRNHGVGSSVIGRVLERPLSFLEDRSFTDVQSKTAGTLVDIDQKRLGYLVNSELGAGANRFGGDKDLYAGVTVRPRRFDRIRTTDTLCTIVSPKRADLDLQRQFQECFAIE
jgi:thymidine phosphorylase